MMHASHPSMKIVLAAGGTGGHIFPAEALAEALQKHSAPCVFITDRRFKQYNSASYKGVLGTIPMHLIYAGSLGGGVWKKMLGACGILIGIMQAILLLRRIKPKAVVGFGGYPSFPTMMAASILGIETVIHEQNSVLGKANRVLAKRVDYIATTYEHTQKIPRQLKAQVICTGNPVRANIRALGAINYPELKTDGLLKVLVMGGSQGATIFSHILPQAMALLPEPLRARIRLDQQCRVTDIEQVRAAYAALNMQVDLAPFFYDVAVRLAASHVVITRSGASTIAELTVSGRPAILVPYPQATDNHQMYNAMAMEDAGAGFMMHQEGFTAEALAARLEIYLTHPELLPVAAEKSRKLGKPDAAAALAALVLG